jgi:hypothetical protein
VYERIHAGMTRASKYCHDNPAAAQESFPTPNEVSDDLTELKTVLDEIKRCQKDTEKRRAT